MFVLTDDPGSGRCFLLRNTRRKEIDKIGRGHKKDHKNTASGSI
jgi:hypothetical protein